jgi:hypothetical protein
MAKPLIASFLLFLFTGCSKAQTDNSIHIYIPINYTGWVNLVFNDSASTIEPLTFIICSPGWTNNAEQQNIISTTLTLLISGSG